MFHGSSLLPWNPKSRGLKLALGIRRQKLHAATCGSCSYMWVMQRHVQVTGEGICAGLTQVRGRGSNTLKGHQGLAYRLPVLDPCLKQQPRHTMPTLYCLQWCGMGVEVSNMAGKAVYFVLLCCLSKHILAGLQRLKVALPTQNSCTKASARSLETCLVKKGSGSFDAQRGGNLLWRQ